MKVVIGLWFVLSCVMMGGMVRGQFDFDGMFVDGFNRTIHACIGRETNEIHLGISQVNNPYFVPSKYI